MPLCITNADLDKLIEFYRERERTDEQPGAHGTAQKTAAALQELRRARAKLAELSKGGRTDE